MFLVVLPNDDEEPSVWAFCTSRTMMRNSNILMSASSRAERWGEWCSRAENEHALVLAEKRSEKRSEKKSEKRSKKRRKTFCRGSGWWVLVRWGDEEQQGAERWGDEEQQGGSVWGGTVRGGAPWRRSISTVLEGEGEEKNEVLFDEHSDEYYEERVYFYY